MKIIRIRGGSLTIGLSLFLLAGACAGSVICNTMSDGMKQELLATGEFAVTAEVLSRMDMMSLFLRIMVMRFWQLILLLLIASVSIAPVLSAAAVWYMGCSSAMLVCRLTMEFGLAGLWKYFLLNFPQCLIYIPVWYLLFWWMPTRRKRLTASSVAVFMFMTLLGVALESLINPLVLLLW